MDQPDVLRLVRQFLSRHYDSDRLKALCTSLDASSEILRGESLAEKITSLVLECNHRHILSELLANLATEFPLAFGESGLQNTPRFIALLEGQISAHSVGVSKGSAITAHDFASHGRRGPSDAVQRVGLIIIAVLVFGLILVIFSQPMDSVFNAFSTETELHSQIGNADPISKNVSSEIMTPDLILRPIRILAQVIIAFIVLLAGLVQLTGWSIRDLIGKAPPEAMVESFPFHVVQSQEELLSLLFPHPTSPLVPDRLIPYLPRNIDQIHSALKDRGRVLIRGRSKTGKSRAAAEALSHLWHTTPTILLAKDFVELRPPFRIPLDLRSRNLVLFFDDVDRYCPNALALDKFRDTIEFFADFCHDQSDLRVIATARQEHEFWQKLRYGKSDAWSQFELLTLPSVSESDAKDLLCHLANRYKLEIHSPVVEEIAAKNDGTFLNIILSVRKWLAEDILEVGPAQATEFASTLTATWRRRYEQLLSHITAVGPIYAAVDLLQNLDVPLRPSTVISLASEMGSSPTFHVIDGFLQRQRYSLETSPQFAWYRNQKKRRAAIILAGAAGIVALYGLVALFLRYLPAKHQAEIMNILLERWAQFLIVLPLIVLIMPLVAALVTLWYRNRKLREIGSVLNYLTATEVSFDSKQLRPYEAQFAGYGRVRAWTAPQYRGIGTTTQFRQYMAPKLARLYLREAQELWQIGQNTPARTLVLLATDFAPDHPIPRYLLGQLYYEAGEYERALVELRQSTATNRDTTSDLAQNLVALCNYRLGRFDQAEAAANEVLVSTPNSGTALAIRALARLEQGKTQLAQADVRQAAAANQPASREVQVLLDQHSSLQVQSEGGGKVPDRDSEISASGLRHFIPKLKHAFILLVLLASLGLPFIGIPGLGEKMNADARFSTQLTTAILKLFPQAPLLLSVRAYAYYRLGDFDRALSDINEAAEVDSSYAPLIVLRGIIYRMKGAYEVALENHDVAVGLDSGSAYAYIERGITYREIGDYEAALVDFGRALEKEPDACRALIDRGLTYHYWMGEYQNALYDFDKAIEICPDVLRTHFVRGWIFAWMGQYERALADFEEALSGNEQYGWMFLERGDLYRIMGKYEQALLDYAEAKKRDPGDIESYSRRADIYIEMGQDDKAIADFSEAIRRNRNQSEPYKERGRTYRDLGEYDLALLDFQEALRLSSDSIFDKIQVYLERGNTYVEMGEFDLALADFDEVLRLEPDNVSAFWWRAAAHRYLGEYDLALADCEEAVLRNPDNGQMLFFQASIMREMGNHQLALAKYEEALKLKGYEYRAHVHRAETYLDLGEHRLALIEYNKARRLDPYAGESYYGSALVYRRMQNYELALAEYEEAERRQPYGAWIPHSRGSLYLDVGKYELAIASFEDALRLIPYYAYPYDAIGATYLEMGLLDRALETYDRALRENPYNPHPYSMRAKAYLTRGEFSLALIECDKALRLKPHDVELLFARAQVYRKMGEYASALADYDTIQRFQPFKSELYEERANAYAEMGRSDLALATYDEGLRIWPYEATLYYGRAQVYRDMGRYDLALAQFDEGLGRKPYDTKLHYGRADTLREMGEKELAIAEFESALSLTPQDSWLHVGLGMIHVSNGDYESAVAEFDQALRIDPYLDSARYERGTTLQDLGQHERSLADFNRAIAIVDTQQFADYIGRGRAYRAMGDYDKALADFEAALRMTNANPAVHHELGITYREMGKLDLAEIEMLEAKRLASGGDIANQSYHFLKRR